MCKDVKKTNLENCGHLIFTNELSPSKSKRLGFSAAAQDDWLPRRSLFMSWRPPEPEALPVQDLAASSFPDVRTNPCSSECLSTKQSTHSPQKMLQSKSPSQW
ncbi:hypothetical protein FQA47_022956 [Oryzias melastigma]|uniref:Uncharacterized protein n=1 Tax=Oryzias melastigma TaxID=30732 RepID=A0A834CNJ1_ORYME|nr:hypothetical protein FQA47_022956 [Oryzias melastigma]